MRSYAIELANTPLELRQQLHAAMLAAGELIYESTRFHKDKHYTAHSYLICATDYIWGAANRITRPTITIQDFFFKFFPQQATATELMRNYAIIIEGTSVKDRQALLSFLKGNKEPLESCVYDETGNFQEEEDYTYYDYLRYNKATNKWYGEPYSNGLPTISIADFITKFTPTKVEVPTDYAIDIRNSSISDRITIRNFLKDIGATIESYLLEKNSHYTLLEDYRDYNYIRPVGNRWERMVGTEGKPTISINGFIAKFAHLAPTTPKVVEPTTIQVGQVYKNSNGKKCTIKKLVNFTDVIYTHEDGKDYNTTIVNIKKNWELQTMETIKAEPNKYLNRKIQIGDYIERVKDSKPSIKVGAIHLVTGFGFGNDPIIKAINNSPWDAENFKVVNPEHPSHPNYAQTVEEGLATKMVEQLEKKTTGAKATTWTIPRSPYMEEQTTKGNTFMSKLKVTAEQTVDQNKQALVIASKMEAGRIINKQVLKQLTPHLPFFVQGYTKSPFAPFVAANLVAMVANHTQNAKLQKVSELMVLGAADSGVTAFNLDKIIDDILANIKLPAGISFDTEE